jgi:adenylate kinase family enzyme
VGPTGSGKSPLGNHLAGHGWNGRRCDHFDFGDRLREVARGRVRGFASDEVAFVGDVLQTGALLENETFHLAERILRAFLDACRMRPGDLLVMNGLPRHPSQATAVDGIVAIDTLIHLNCSPEVVFERLRLDTGGDRGSRRDDHLELVREKLRIFTSRTASLVAHYRERGAVVHDLQVGVTTAPAELLVRLA